MIDLHRALSCLNSHQLRQVWNEGSLFSPISTGTCSSAAAKVRSVDQGLVRLLLLLPR